MPTIHISAEKEQIAPLVIMPGDPKRAQFIATKYLAGAKLVSDVRGIQAYTGTFKNTKVTVMASGMGIPSMGIYSYELYEKYDVKAIIRIGTAGSKGKNFKLGDLVLANKVYSESSYGNLILGKKNEYVQTNSEINEHIIKTAIDNNIKINPIDIRSTEAFYEIENKSNIDIVEMEAFALFVNAIKFNRIAASILTVSDLLLTNESLSINSREQKLDDMILLALSSIIEY